MCSQLKIHGTRPRGALVAQAVLLVQIHTPYSHFFYFFEGLEISANNRSHSKIILKTVAAWLLDYGLILLGWGEGG